MVQMPVCLLILVLMLVARAYAGAALEDADSQVLLGVKPPGDILVDAVDLSRLSCPSRLLRLRGCACCRRGASASR
jgi:hypothetical protein